eukprot:1192473-Prorocentrum_minimum.AAC.1
MELRKGDPGGMGGQTSDLTRARLTRADRSSIQFCNSFIANQRDPRLTLSGYAHEISRTSRKNSRGGGFHNLVVSIPPPPVPTR